jgi:hypothetical protein
MGGVGQGQYGCGEQQGHQPASHQIVNYGCVAAVEARLAARASGPGMGGVLVMRPGASGAHGGLLARCRQDMFGGHGRWCCAAPLPHWGGGLGLGSPVRRMGCELHVLIPLYGQLARGERAWSAGLYLMFPCYHYSRRYSRLHLGAGKTRAAPSSSVGGGVILGCPGARLEGARGWRGSRPTARPGRFGAPGDLGSRARADQQQQEIPALARHASRLRRRDEGGCGWGIGARGGAEAALGGEGKWLRAVGRC